LKFCCYEQPLRSLAMTEFNDNSKIATSFRYRSIPQEYWYNTFTIVHCCTGVPRNDTENVDRNDNVGHHKKPHFVITSVRDLILNEHSEYENQSILALRQSLGHDIL